MEKYQLTALKPSQFKLPRKSIKDIACGAYHSFAVDRSDRVYGWGLSNFGQTGVPGLAGEDNSMTDTATVIDVLRGYEIVDIQGGTHHSIACTSDGHVLVWGRCDDGQAGVDLSSLPNPKEQLIFDERNKPRILNQPVIVKGVKGASVAAGIDDSFAVTLQGEVFSWGFSANYRTGLGTEEPVLEATCVENSAIKGKKLTFVGCGGQFSVLAGPAEEE